MFFKNKKTIGFLIIISIAVIGFAFQKYGDNNVFAAGNGNMYGYAWSENIGWINTDNTLTNNYKVSIAVPGGAFSGYAWSDNIGWISFQAADVAGCPSGTCQAAINLTTGVVTGWARILSLKNEYGANYGWISLGGTSANYGLVYDMSTCGNVEGCVIKGTIGDPNTDGNKNRWAYSGDSVAGAKDGIGWIDFSRVKLQNMVMVSASGITVTPTVNRIVNGNPVSINSKLNITKSTNNDTITINSTLGNSLVIGDTLNVGVMVNGSDGSDLTSLSTNNWTCKFGKTPSTLTTCDASTSGDVVPAAGSAQIQFKNTGTYQITYEAKNGSFDQPSVITVTVPALKELKSPPAP